MLVSLFVLFTHVHLCRDLLLLLLLIIFIFIFNNIIIIFLSVRLFVCSSVRNFEETASNSVSAGKDVSAKQTHRASPPSLLKAIIIS